MPLTNEEEYIQREIARPEIVQSICGCCGESDNEENMRSMNVWTRTRGVREEEVCDDCTRNCNYCGLNFAVQQRWYSDYCPTCQEQIDERNDNSDDDSGEYYPTLKYFGIGPKYFGLELETEIASGDRSNKITELRNILGNFASLKGDGSLCYGIEIATQPATLEEHKKHLLPLFAKMPKGLRSWKESSCGIHVHVSRVVMSELTIAKTVCFVNAAHNRRFIAQIAGRDRNSYCKILPKKMGTAAKYNDDRYEAVNLQNDRTIEFRLFKGTLRQASVFKALEFTDALTTYCGKAARSIRDSQSRVRFIAFVEENAAVWPNLCAFITAKWLGRETDLTNAIGYSARENQEQFNQLEEV